jgi:hypothetical protein
MVGLSLYKILLGYLLGQMGNLTGILIFTVAMIMHFLVIDFHLMEMHQRAYQNIGSWALSFSFLIGWAASLIMTIDPPSLPCLYPSCRVERF